MLGFHVSIPQQPRPHTGHDADLPQVRGVGLHECLFSGGAALRRDVFFTLIHRSHFVITLATKVEGIEPFRKIGEGVPHALHPPLAVLISAQLEPPRRRADPLR